MRKTAAYYYADGQRIALERDREFVAVDFSRAIDGGRLSLDRLRQDAQPLVRDLALVRDTALSREVRNALDAAGAIQPVYRHGSTVIVVLPEVRVDFERRQRAPLLSFVKKGQVPAAIERDDGGHLVLRPRSGSGADALALANGVYEAIHPKMAQARFLRVIQKPAG